MSSTLKKELKMKYFWKNWISSIELESLFDLSRRRINQITKILLENNLIEKAYLVELKDDNLLGKPIYKWRA